MLASCTIAFKVPLTETPLPRRFIGRLLGHFIKAKMYNDALWKKNLPTSPDFLIKDQRDFDKEKEQLITLIKKFYAAGPLGISKHPHPLENLPGQWGKFIFKHMDHHLQQFGV